MEKMWQLCDECFVAPLDTKEAKEEFAGRCDVQLIDVSHGFDGRLDPCSLGQMYWCARFVQDALAQTNANLVWCVGHEHKTITSCVLLLGSYLVLIRGISPTDVADSFGPLTEQLLQFGADDKTSNNPNRFTVHDCWRALHHAKRKDWVDFLNDDIDVDRTIEMREYLHYDNPANGVLHVIIPSELIAFQCPSNLPSKCFETGRAWADVEGRRHFAPAFFAEVLSSDFDVSVIVSCDGSPCHAAGPHDGADGSRAHYNERPFAAHGVAVERLAARRAPGAPPDGALLRDTDRFLTLARLAPGPVAIHGGPGAAGLGPRAELLAAALLIIRHGLDAAAALAWLSIVHPPAPPRPLAFSLLPATPAPPRPLARSSSLSRALGRLALAAAAFGGSLGALPTPQGEDDDAS